jgi:hypothetical protein
MARNYSQQVGVFAGMLALIETGLGSILHALHVPLTGFFLSLNQAYFLSFSVKIMRRESTARFNGLHISTIVALLKSLSPAGKKLTPMLAIAMQGVLFSAGTLILGANFLGVALGAILLSLWGFIQPLALTGLIFGASLHPSKVLEITQYYARMVERIVPNFSDHLLSIILGLVLVKVILALGLASHAWMAHTSTVKSWLGKLIKTGAQIKPVKEYPNDSKPSAPVVLALKELLRPIILFPLALTGCFFWFAEHNAAKSIWMMLRPLAIAFLFYLAFYSALWQMAMSKLYTKFPSLAVSAEFMKRKRNASGGG